MISETGISSEKLRKGQMSEEEWQRLFPTFLLRKCTSLY
jgi:replicative DNA helicase